MRIKDRYRRTVPLRSADEASRVFTRRGNCRYIDAVVKGVRPIRIADERPDAVLAGHTSFDC